jgi:hypothetical protein
VPFEVSWCVIGKDPDSEPFVFHSWSDAVKFLHDEVWYLSRDFYSQGDISSQDEASDAMNALGHLRDAEPKSHVWKISDISYWITVVDPLEGLWKL